MALIGQIQVVLYGWSGGPGVNTFYLANLAGTDPASHANDFASQMHACYTALAPHCPGGVNFAVQSVMKVFDVETAALTAVVPLDDRDPIAGTGNGSAAQESRATQCNVKLLTDRIVGNRVLAGRHFIGPIGGNCLDGQGHITTGFADVVIGAYAGMLDILGGTRLAVWSQPKEERPSANGGTLPAQVGAYGLVQSVAPQSIPGTLRSRKQ